MWSSLCNSIENSLSGNGRCWRRNGHSPNANVGPYSKNHYVAISNVVFRISLDIRVGFNARWVEMARFIAIQIKDAIKSFLADEARGLNDELGVSMSRYEVNVSMYGTRFFIIVRCTSGIFTLLSLYPLLWIQITLFCLLCGLLLTMTASSSYYLGTSALHIHLSLN